MRFTHILLKLALTLALAIGCATALADRLDWKQTFSNSGDASIAAMAADDSGVYVVGRVRGALDDQSVAGHELDAYVRKYGFDGQLLWTRQFEVEAPELLSIDEAFAVAANDTGVYVGGRKRCTDRLCTEGAYVVHFDSSGSRQWTYQTESQSDIFTMTSDGSGVYLGGLARGAYGPPMVTKLDFAGNLLWERTFGEGRMYLRDITLHDDRLYAVGNFGDVDVRIFDPDGNEVGTLGDGTRHGHVVRVDDSGVYLGGSEASTHGYWRLWKYTPSGSLAWDHAIVAQPADMQLTENSVDVVLFEGGVHRITRYLRNGGFLSREMFDWGRPAFSVLRDEAIFYAGSDRGGSGRPVPLMVARVSPGFPPQFASFSLNGVPALAVLKRNAAGAANVWIKDATSGALISQLRFGSEYHPHEFVVVPDLNGNSAPEVALLGAHRTSGELVARVRDTATDALVAQVSFGDRHQPWGFDVVPEVTADGRPGLAVFGVSFEDRSIRTRIHALPGGAARVVEFGRWQTSFGRVQQAVLPTGSPDGSPAIALLSDPGLSTSGHYLYVREALTGEALRTVHPDHWQFQLGVSAFTDLNGNLGSEVVTLESGKFGPGRRATFRDPRDGSLVRQIYFSHLGEAVQLVELPDLNGNGSPEVALLGRDGGGEGIDTVEIKDAQTQAWLNQVVLWRKDRRLLGFDLVPDVDGKGTPELAELQEHETTGSLSVLMKDARTGADVGRIYF